jgi:hypothetical protein
MAGPTPARLYCRLKNPSRDPRIPFSKTVLRTLVKSIFISSTEAAHAGNKQFEMDRFCTFFWFFI